MPAETARCFNKTYFYKEVFSFDHLRFESHSLVYRKCLRDSFFNLSFHLLKNISNFYSIKSRYLNVFKASLQCLKFFKKLD